MTPLRLIDQVKQTECGECTACCTIMPVAPLGINGYRIMPFGSLTTYAFLLNEADYKRPANPTCTLNREATQEHLYYGPVDEKTDLDNYPHFQQAG